MPQIINFEIDAEKLFPLSASERITHIRKVMESSVFTHPYYLESMVKQILKDEIKNSIAEKKPKIDEIINEYLDVNLTEYSSAKSSIEETFRSFLNSQWIDLKPQITEYLETRLKANNNSLFSKIILNNIGRQILDVLLVKFSGRSPSSDYDEDEDGDEE